MVQHSTYQLLTVEQVPVSDDLFSRVCRSTPDGAVEIVSELPENTRARLALFCNARTHLRAAGRAIAGTYSQEILSMEGGPAGFMLHQQVSLGPDTWVHKY